MAVPAAARVIPVPPVNPSTPSLGTASVVNDINPELQARAVAESAATPSAADPLQGGAKADASGKDWTEAAPKPQEAKEPPKEPLTQMLIDHVKTLWVLSARVVDLMSVSSPKQDANQVQALAQTRNQDPSAVPGVLAKEVLTYSPSKIAKTGKTE